ncbi:MAG: HepT-like ribonuclease domain-containing protein [Coriobacteriia bacterium]|nr:HepT-like ribonuclease domain-containing protein [Coriobacteriia bacterium]
MRDPGVYLEDMVGACERIIAFSRGVSDAELMDEDAPLRGAVLHQLMVLGEAAKNVPVEWKRRYPGIPWARVMGMRDVVAHYYFGLKDSMAVDTVRAGVPVLLPMLRDMLARIDQEYPQP